MSVALAKIAFRVATPVFARWPAKISSKRNFINQLSRLMPRVTGVEQEKTCVGNLHARWFRPENESGDRIIYYLIGGGYAICSLDTHHRLISHIAHAARANVFAIEYRLAPEHPFPAAIDDALAGYDHLLKTGVAAKNIVFGGDSAGGGLAVATMLALKKSKKKLPRGAFLLSPYADMTWDTPSVKENYKKDPMAAGLNMPWADWYMGAQDKRNPLASPIFANLKGLPPLYIQAGGDEILRDNSRLLHERALKHEVAAHYEEWPGMFHVFQLLGNTAPESRAAIKKIGAFVQSNEHCEI